MWMGIGEWHPKKGDGHAERQLFYRSLLKGLVGTRSISMLEGQISAGKC